MAYDTKDGAARLAGEFARIATESPGRAATEIVAEAIAGEIARAFADADVEVHIVVKREIAAVPGVVEIDETVKGVIK